MSDRNDQTTDSVALLRKKRKVSVFDMRFDFWLYIISELLLYTMTYKVLFNVKLESSAFKWGLSLLGIFGFHFAVLTLKGATWSANLSIFSMIFIPLLLLNSDNRKQNFFLYPFVVVEASVLGIAFSFVVSFLSGVGEEQIIYNYYVASFCQFLAALILLAIDCYRKRKEIRLEELEIGKKEYFIFYSVLIASFVIVSSVQILAEDFPDNEEVLHIGLFTCLVCIALVILAIWREVLANREWIFKQKEEEQRNYIALQKQHYEDMLTQDRKIRRFRHDIKSHVRALLSYCESGQYEAMEEYLKKMMEESSLYEKTKLRVIMRWTR